MNVTYIWRGPSPYRVDFFNELGKNCNLTVYFERCPKDITDKNAQWFVNSALNFNAIYLNGFNLFHKWWFCKDIFKYLRSLIRSEVLVIGMYSTLTQALLIIILKMLRKKYILNADGGFIKKENSFVRFIKKRLIGGASMYLSPGTKTNIYLTNYGAKSHIHIYPFTSILRKDILKPSDSDKVSAKSKLGIEESINILFTGQFIHRKGIDILLKACEGLPQNCGVYIVGGTPTPDYLSIIEDLHLRNIHFIGFTKPYELKEYYKACDIYVLPTREDIWGLVINEAMAYGMPIVTTDKCLAGVELIEPNINGLIVPSEDISALKNAICKFVNDHEFRHLASNNNIKKSEGYTIENMAKSHLECFQNYTLQSRNT